MSSLIRTLLEGLRPAAIMLVLAATAMQTAAAADLQKQRSDYLAAEAALAAGDRPLFRQLSASLGHYPLHPYLVRSQLRQDLDRGSDAGVAEFLDAHQGEPVAPALQRDWLRFLAANKRWLEFEHAYRNFGTHYECLRRQGLLATGRQSEALSGMETIWLHGRSLPDSCDPVLAHWTRAGGRTQALIWQRFQLALEAGQSSLARYLARMLTGGKAQEAQLWLAVQRDPGEILRLHSSQRYLPPGLARFALDRWSRLDSPEAAAAYDRLLAGGRIKRGDSLDLERRLAVFMAARGHSDAPQRLARLPDHARNDTSGEWQTRIALRDGDWPAVLGNLGKLSAEAQAKPEWRYWRARALAAAGRQREARTIYEGLARERGYYSFLAADRIGAAYQFNHQPLAVEGTQLDRVANIPAVERALELHALGRGSDARREWHFGIRDLDAEGLSAAARIAHDHGWHDRAIATVAKARHFDDLGMRFPLAFRTEVTRAAGQQRLEPAWVYGILRQESLFQPDAQSRAGALGLMQLMPATGRRMARELKVTYRGRSTLLSSSTNIRLGTLYLRQSRERLQDHPILAAAAYNAGPNRVQSWLPRQNSMDADLWAELIPFHETRGYVKRVMENTVIYDYRLGNGGPRLSERLGAIRPPSTNSRLEPTGPQGSSG